MTLPATVNFELYAGFRSADAGMPDGVACLDATARRNLVARAGIRHSSHLDQAVSFGVMAARAALTPGDDAVGILALNGPWNIWASFETALRAREAGARFINPMRFPATLVSHVPTRVAQELGATRFAYAVGHDDAAFLDAILLAARLVTAGHARTVLALAVCHGDAPLARIAERAGWHAPPLDVALCARVGTPAGGGTPLSLHWYNARQCTTLPGPALSAAAAVVLADAARGARDGCLGDTAQRLATWGVRAERPGC